MPRDVGYGVPAVGPHTMALTKGLFVAIELLRCLFQLTSTTSLSEDSDGGKDEKQVVEEKRESASSSLIDLTVPQQAELIESVNVPGECDSTDASSKPLENELLIELEPTETPSNDNQITNKIFAPVPADQNSLESQSPLWVSNLNQTKEL